MQELIDIIVNVLMRLHDGEKVKIKKLNDLSYVFTGEGMDSSGQKYEFDINVNFKLKQKEMEQTLKKYMENKEEIINGWFYRFKFI